MKKRIPLTVMGEVPAGFPTCRDRHKRAHGEILGCKRYYRSLAASALAQVETHRQFDETSSERRQGLLATCGVNDHFSERTFLLIIGIIQRELPEIQSQTPERSCNKISTAICHIVMACFVLEVSSQGPEGEIRELSSPRQGHCIRESTPLLCFIGRLQELYWRSCLEYGILMPNGIRLP